MATSKKKSTRRAKASWERGYFAHNYWQGERKLGTVQLGPKGEWDGVYRWQAGTRQGECSSLAAAKQAVEQMVNFGTSQISLFEEG